MWCLQVINYFQHDRFLFNFLSVVPRKQGLLFYLFIYFFNKILMDFFITYIAKYFYNKEHAALYFINVILRKEKTDQFLAYHSAVDITVAWEQRWKKERKTKTYLFMFVTAFTFVYNDNYIPTLLLLFLFFFLLQFFKPAFSQAFTDSLSSLLF